MPDLRVVSNVAVYLDWFGVYFDCKLKRGMDCKIVRPEYVEGEYAGQKKRVGKNISLFW